MPLAGGRPERHNSRTRLFALAPGVPSPGPRLETSQR